MLQYTFIGSAANVQAGMQDFIEDTQVDELMIVSNIFNHAARLRSYELIAPFREN